MSGKLLERYDDRIAEGLSCYDRVTITGTLPTMCYAAGMTKFLNATRRRIFDYPRFAEPLRERAASLAAAAGIAIEHIGKKHVRKAPVVAEVLEQRGGHPSLVQVISAMEGCGTCKPWHGNPAHKTFLRPDGGQCRHDCFYLVDADPGLIHLRVPTPAPRLRLMESYICGTIGQAPAGEGGVEPKQPMVHGLGAGRAVSTGRAA
jgi:hypothetical protein